MNKIKLLVVIIVFLFQTGNLFSDSSLFNVDNILVKKSNVVNKETLLNQAFKKGFLQFIEKVLVKKDADNLSNISIEKIKSFISTYQIIENNTQDQASEFAVNIKFSRERINSYFYLENILYADISKGKIVIFPVLIENNTFYLFSENYFYNNWNVENENSLNNYIEYIMPIENLDDIEFINKNKNKLENISLENILANYDIGNYVFLLIEPNGNKINIFLKSLVANNEIIKNISYDMISDNKNNEYKNIIKKIKSEINEIWKSQNLIDVRTPSFLNVRLNIQKINDLLIVQNILSKIDLIENYNVSELNKDYVQIKIKFLGNINKIKKKLSENGINFTIQNNEWQINLI